MWLLTSMCAAFFAEAVASPSLFHTLSLSLCAVAIELTSSSRYRLPVSSLIEALFVLSSSKQVSKVMNLL